MYKTVNFFSDVKHFQHICTSSIYIYVLSFLWCVLAASTPVIFHFCPFSQFLRVSRFLWTQRIFFCTLSRAIWVALNWEDCSLIDSKNNCTWRFENNIYSHKYSDKKMHSKDFCQFQSKWQHFISARLAASKDLFYHEYK